MNYIIMGLLFAIGWYVVKLIYDIVSELLFERLHKAAWYLKVAGRKPRSIEQPGDIKAVKNKIGFM